MCFGLHLIASDARLSTGGALLTFALQKLAQPQDACRIPEYLDTYPAFVRRMVLLVVVSLRYQAVSMPWIPAVCLNSTTCRSYYTSTQPCLTIIVLLPASHLKMDVNAEGCCAGDIGLDTFDLRLRSQLYCWQHLH
jgi:hypothetical protein